MVRERHGPEPFCVATASVIYTWDEETWVLNFNLRAQISTWAVFLCEVFAFAVATAIIVIREREGGREKSHIPLPGFQDPFNHSPSYLLNISPTDPLGGACINRTKVTTAKYRVLRAFKNLSMLHPFISTWMNQFHLQG